MRAFFYLTLCLTAVAAVPSRSQKIIGGSITTIDQYPSMVALLLTWDMSTYWATCGGTMLNTRSILTAAHCPELDPAIIWRVRVGSSFADSGGIVHAFESIAIHPHYFGNGLDYDVAVMRTATPISPSNFARPAFIAGPNYNMADNSVVYATGWGDIEVGGPGSPQLRHVQIWTINQNICAQRYATVGSVIIDTHLCTGWLDVGGRDQCQGDSGGPVYHNGVVVGICSWGHECATPFFPGVNARVSWFSTWIQANA